MAGNLRIVVLAENTAGARGVLAEHGLALWMEVNGLNLLFDTGQGMVLRHNAEVLGVDLARADAIVLSHGHYDHADGLPEVLDLCPRATVYVHPRAFEAKFGRRKDGVVRSVGSMVSSLEDLRARVSHVVTTEEPTRLAEGVQLTGEIPRRHAFEESDAPFYLDEACTREDHLLDDQAMFVETAAGLVVLTGCAHSGLVNTLHYISQLTGGRQVYAVLGGFHLHGADEERITQTTAALHRHDVQRVYPAHCTGMRAIAGMMQVFGERCIPASAGLEITLP
ncbi:MAG: MBL fold metallo-hydrolase [bacterium]|nr:MBL fold metallo-hydrolase [bacterium]